MGGARGLDDYRLGRLPSRIRAFQALLLCTVCTAIGAETDVPLTTAVDVLVLKTEKETGRQPNAVKWNGNNLTRTDLSGAVNLTNRKKVGKITHKQIEEIAKMKMPDLNTDKLESACSMVAGTAKSMGLEIM